MRRANNSNFKKSNLKKRDEQKIEKKALFIISCEGEKTEPNFLKSIIKQLIETKIIAKGSIVIAAHQHTNPSGVLNDLMNYKIDYNLFDSKWIVIDRDEVRTISSNSSGHTAEDFSSTLEKAKNNDIKVAWSNPCFEIYIIEHFIFRDTGGDRKEIQAKALELLKQAGEIDKNSKVEDLKAIENLYDILEPRRETGLKNIVRLMKKQKDTPPVDCNPGTKFHELVQQLEMLKDNKK